jgi:hypothetical protein
MDCETIPGATLEALKCDLMRSGFKIKCAKERTRGAKVVKSVWALIDCDAVMGALQWLKVKTSKSWKWSCTSCLSPWKKNRHGTRMMKCTNNAGLSFTLTLEEPPDAILNAWKKERIEYYKRFEAFGELLNKCIILPSEMNFENTLDLRGETSTAFWTAMLEHPSVPSILGIAGQFYKEIPVEEEGKY